MMAAPLNQDPLFGMVTNGNTYLFLKVSRQGQREYDFSEVYTLLSRRNHLYDVLQILKRIARLC